MVKRVPFASLKSFQPLAATKSSTVAAKELLRKAFQDIWAYHRNFDFSDGEASHLQCQLGNLDSNPP